MSHVATIQIEIHDLEALKKACEKMGLEFRENQKTHRWYGQWMNDFNDDDAAYRTIDPKEFGKCDHAIGLPGDNSSYEVGVKRIPGKKGYTLLFDFWQQHKMVKALGGRACEGLAQRYAAEVTKKKLRREGWQTKETVKENGEIVVVGVKG